MEIYTPPLFKVSAPFPMSGIDFASPFRLAIPVSDISLKY